MIVCTCSSCITKTCTDKNGNKQRGQFVTRPVQLQHHLSDLEISPVNPPSREASPEPQLLDDDQESHYAALNSAFEDLQLDGRDPSLTVITLVGLFLGWLHLLCGVSRAKCRMARDFILEILGLARHHPILDDSDNQKLPKDIRTTLKHLNIDPELEKKICCPQCFTLYDLSNAPWRCKYKKSPMARVRDEELFELKTAYRGIQDHGTTQKYPSILKDLPPSEVGYPRNVYVTQKLSSWLRWFLSKSTTEADISSWANEVTSSTEEKIFDIQQSTA